MQLRATCTTWHGHVKSGQVRSGEVRLGQGQHVGVGQVRSGRVAQVRARPGKVGGRSG